MMKICQALHPRNDMDKLKVSRKGGRSGHTSIDDGGYSSIQRLEGYIKKNKE